MLTYNKSLKSNVSVQKITYFFDGVDDVKYVACIKIMYLGVGVGDKIFIKFYS